MQAEHSRYLRMLGLCCVGLAALLAAAVLIVDPYGLVRVVDVRGFNAAKTMRLDSGGRVERSIRIWASSPDTLIMGTSRPMQAFDPAGPALSKLDAYNASLPATNMWELDRVGRFALDHGPPGRVLLGVDLLMFSGRRDTRGDFDHSGFSGKPMPLVLLSALLSQRSIENGRDTVRQNRRGKIETEFDSGFVNRSLPFGDRFPHRRFFRKVLEENFFVFDETYRCFEYSPRRVELLSQLASDLAAAGTQVYLFFSPVHVRQLEAMAMMHVDDDLERLKRDLTRAVDLQNRGVASHNPIALWDFSGPGPITTEEVPPEASTEQMRWYWESSHYKPVVGDMIAVRMLGVTGTGLWAPTGFGERLTPRGVEESLRLQALAREAWRDSHPAELHDMRRSFVRTARARGRCGPAKLREVGGFDPSLYLIGPISAGG